MTRHHHVRAGVVLATAVLAASACGTRVSDTRIIKGEAGPAVVTAAPAGATASAALSGTPLTTPTDVAAPIAPTSGAATTGAAAAGSGTSTAGTGSVGTGVTATTAVGASTPTSASGGTQHGKPGGAPSSAATSAPAATSATAPCTAQGAPVVIGQTLATSGVIGAAIANQRLGLQIWAKAVNAKGGVQCHPVQLYSEDDGADPARVTSNFNDLVQNKHSVAIVSAGEPLTMPALRSAAEKARIPIVGGDLIALDWNQSPVAFPQGASPLATFAGSVKTAAAAKPGAHKAGILYCVEATICGLINQNYAAITKQAGVTEGLSVASSLTQSDFTAECQRLKSDGDDIVFFALDGSAISRVARNCGALGYHPAIATVGIAFNEAVASDPNVRADTAYLGSPVVPFLQSDTPGEQEFHAAVSTYAPGQTIDPSTMTGWSSGKLFEEAIDKVASQARSGPITTAMVYQGLSLIKDDTLDGLTTPLTFTANEPNAPLINCYFVLEISNVGFSAPNGSAKTCF